MKNINFVLTDEEAKDVIETKEKLKLSWHDFIIHANNLLKHIEVKNG